MKKSNWVILIIAILLIIIIAIALNWKAVKKIFKDKGPGSPFHFGTNTTTQDVVVPPTPGVIGKKVYANESDTKIRSGAYVNDGWINNIICKLETAYEPAPVVEGIVKDTEGASHNWYKVKLGVPQLCDDYTYGYIREDVVTLK